MNLQLTLNEFVFVAYLLGIIIHIAVPTWEWSWRVFIANTAIVIVAWITTEYFIVKEPVNDFFKIIYVIICIAFTFSPIQVYKFLVTLGVDLYQTYLKTRKDKLLNSIDKKIEENKKEEEVKNENS